jgi:hypothetical protein
MRPEDLRRRAQSAMIAALCQTSPAQWHFRELGRHREHLFDLLLHRPDALPDELEACDERLWFWAEQIEWQWRWP